MSLRQRLFAALRVTIAQIPVILEQASASEGSYAFEKCTESLSNFLLITHGIRVNKVLVSI